MCECPAGQSDEPQPTSEEAIHRAASPSSPLKTFARHGGSLAVEVRSPDDRWSKLPAKVAEDLAAGVHVVCVVEPKEEFVLVDTPDAAPRQLSDDDLLKLPDVLPEFSLEVREFFE